METVTISPKFQVVIPKRIRETMNLVAGGKLQVFSHDGRLELVPERPIEEMFGALPGVEVGFEREKDRL